MRSREGTEELKIMLLHFLLMLLILISFLRHFKKSKVAESIDFTEILLLLMFLKMLYGNFILPCCQHSGFGFPDFFFTVFKRLNKVHLSTFD